MLTHSSLTFIGSGNMARSLINGLIDQDWPAQKITATDIFPDAVNAIHAIDTDIHFTTDNKTACEHADVWVLAVKPQVLRQVCLELTTLCLDKKPLIISIAAGIRSTDINRWLGDGQAIVRCMPNTPSLVKLGATGLYATPLVNDDQKKLTEVLMQNVGISAWVNDENLLDGITALSGSGPAYAFLMIEAMEESAIKLGLEPSLARGFAIQTLYGAAALAKQSSDSPSVLRENVTSKGGTTEQALNSFASNHFKDIVFNAMQAAEQKAKILANDLGKDT